MTCCPYLAREVQAPGACSGHTRHQQKLPRVKSVQVVGTPSPLHRHCAQSIQPKSTPDKRRGVPRQGRVMKRANTFGRRCTGPAQVLQIYEVAHVVLLLLLLHVVTVLRVTGVGPIALQLHPLRPLLLPHLPLRLTGSCRHQYSALKTQIQAPRVHGKSNGNTMALCQRSHRRVLQVQHFGHPRLVSRLSTTVIMFLVLPVVTAATIGPVGN